jgi:hypothetical protein
MGKLMGIYGKHVRQAPDMLPVVALLSDSYRHSNKAYGRIAFPVLKVTKWVKRAEFDQVLAGALDDDSEPAEPDPPPKGLKGKPSPHKDYAAVKGRPAHTRRRHDDDQEVPF